MIDQEGTQLLHVQSPGVAPHIVGHFLFVEHVYLKIIQVGQMVLVFPLVVQVKRYFLIRNVVQCTNLVIIQKMGAIKLLIPNGRHPLHGQTSLVCRKGVKPLERFVHLLRPFIFQKIPVEPFPQPQGLVGLIGLCRGIVVGQPLAVEREGHFLGEVW